jgi:hypothetical protein
MTQLITKETAIKLRDGLLANPALSNYHDIASYEAAVKVLAGAGLGHVLLPMRTSTRSKQYGLAMAVVDAKPGTRFRVNTDKGEPPTLVYARCKLRPLTDYAGDLMSICLTQPWWAAPHFFSAMASLLAPGWSETCDMSGGRSGWGCQMRIAFQEHFERVWLAGEREPLQPQAPLVPQLLRFEGAPVLPRLDAAEELEARYGVWESHPDFPRSDWATEAANLETSNSYWDWVAKKLDLEGEG